MRGKPNTTPIEVRTCETCGKEFPFQAVASRLREKAGRFCSRTCLYEWHRSDAYFWSRVDRSDPDGCWPWLKAKRSRGHGYFTINGVATVASRHALILASGQDHPTLFACHTCDNPPCCRPVHLFWGTSKENSLDMCRKGRKPAKLTVALVRAMRKEYGVPAYGQSRRRCLEIAARYAVDWKHVWSVVTRRSWQHVE